MENLVFPLNKMDRKMEKSRSIRFSFGILAALLLVANLFAGVSAATSDIATVNSLKIDGITEQGNSDIAVIAGEQISIATIFTALQDASNIRIEASLEGDKVDVSKEVFIGDVEKGKRYTVGADGTNSLTLNIPYELQDQVSGDLSLYIKIWNGDYRTDYPETVLRVQRQAYKADIMSVTAKDTVKAGEIFPVQVVVKNTGYNDLNDLYTTATLVGLDAKKTAYLGDLVAVDTGSDVTDTASATMYLQVPYDVKPGVYTLEVTSQNADLAPVAKDVQIGVTNDFYNNVIVTDYSKNAAVGQSTDFSVLVANPTNAMKVYRIVSNPTSDVGTTVSDQVIAVPAGTSKTVTVSAIASTQGDHDFKVDVLSGEEIVGSVTLTVNAQGSSVSNPVVILTIVLAIIFLVLLGVLVVLMTKKPKKTEEYGESYY